MCQLNWWLLLIQMYRPKTNEPDKLYQKIDLWNQSAQSDDLDSHADNALCLGFIIFFHFYRTFIDNQVTWVRTLYVFQCLFLKLSSHVRCVPYVNTCFDFTETKKKNNKVVDRKKSVTICFFLLLFRLSTNGIHFTLFALIVAWNNDVNLMKKWAKKLKNRKKYATTQFHCRNSKLRIIVSL